MLGLVFLLLAAVMAIFFFSTRGFGCIALWKELLLPLGLAIGGVALLLL